LWVTRNFRVPHVHLLLRQMSRIYKLP
jgi:hypothetical protein